MRQRELLVLERHCLPEGRAKLAGVALVQMRRQIDECVGARIAPDLLILDPEYIWRLSPGQARVDQLIELHRITVHLQPDRNIGVQRLIFVDDGFERVFFRLRAPHGQRQRDRRLSAGAPRPEPRTGQRSCGEPASEQPAPADSVSGTRAFHGHVSPHRDEP